MKNFYILAILFPSIAIASGYGGAYGINSQYKTIYIGENEFYVYVGKFNESMPTETYITEKECPELMKFIWEIKEQFSCPRNGNSPLSGATYKRTTSKKYTPCTSPPYNDNSPGVVYKCVNGCKNPRVPKIFYEQPWECG